MNARWNYKVAEVSPKLFGDNSEKLQAELDRLGSQGWELVSVVQATMGDTYRLFLKKPA